MVKNPLAIARDPGDRVAIQPLVQEDPWRRKWQPLQYSGLEKSMDRGDWQAIVQRVAKSQTRTHTHTHTHLTISDENVFAIIVILVYIMLSLTNS